MRWAKTTLDDPRALAVLNGLHKSGQTFFKVNAQGSHYIFPARRRLTKLFGQLEAARLLKLALETGLVTPLPFVWNAKPKPRKTPKPKVDKPPKPKRLKKVIVTNDEEPEPVPFGKHKNDRYSLIQRGEFWGIFYSDSGRAEIISRWKADALKTLARLQKPEKKVYRKPLDQVVDAILEKQAA